jgi:hypothetical protein
MIELAGWLGAPMRKKMRTGAWCPRFASFFWTLTWAEEDSGLPTGQLRLNLYHAHFPERIMPETTPLSVIPG